MSRINHYLFWGLFVWVVWSGASLSSQGQEGLSASREEGLLRKGLHRLTVNAFAQPAGESLSPPGPPTPTLPPAVLPSPPQAEQERTINILQMIRYGGTIGYIIIFLSVVGLGLAIEHAITLRRARLIPPQAVDQIRQLIQEGRYEEAPQICGDSFIERVVSAGLAEARQGYMPMVKAMEDASENFTARLARRIEHLNIIGNVSPMLGLLGTVVGMLMTFNEIHEASKLTGVVDPRLLAGGIFQALVTTVQGLVVAIPAMYLFAIFRNRLDALSAEAALVAEQLIAPLKPAGQPAEKLYETP